MNRPAASQRPGRSTRRGPADSPSRAATIGWCGLLSALVLIVFGRVLANGFVDWDDPTAILYFPAYNPPTLQSLASMWEWKRDATLFYVPVLYTVWWTTALVARRDGATGGPMSAGPEPFSAVPFHALGLLAHLAATLAVFLLLRRILSPKVGGRRTDAPAALGAALFALHPIQVEAVAWASTFYTPASAALALLAALAFIRSGDAEANRPRWNWYAAGSALFVASLLTKPAMLFLPLLLLAIDGLLLGRSRRALARSSLLLLPWLSAGLAVGVLTSRYRQDESILFHPPMMQRVLVAGDAAAFYVRQIVLPIGFVPDYGRTPQSVLADTTAAGAWTALPLAITLLALLLIHRSPWVMVAWLAFGVGVGATLGLVPFEFQLYSTVADRYLYFSMLGAALATAAGLTRLLGGRVGADPAAVAPSTADDGKAAAAAAPARTKPFTARRALPAGPIYTASAVVLAVLGVLSIVQAGRWAGTASLFEYTLSLRPGSSASHRAMMFDSVRQRQFDRAIAHGQAALAAHPKDARLWWFLGIAYMERAAQRPTPGGTADKTGFLVAAEHLRKAATLLREQQDNLQVTLGAALAQAGELQQAEAAFAEARRLNPQNADAHRNLAIVYRMTARPQQAAEAAEAAAALQPSDPNLAAMARQYRAEAQRTSTPRPTP